MATFEGNGCGADKEAVKGRLRKIVALGPSEIVLNWDLETGKLLTVEVKHGGAVCQTWTYAYGTALQNKHRLTEVTMTRAADEPPEEAKTYRVKLRYFADQYPGEIGGTAGDLMQIDVTESLTPFPGGMEDPKNKLTRSWYYRYFTGPYTGSGDGAGYAHQVRELRGRLGDAPGKRALAKARRDAIRRVLVAYGFLLVQRRPITPRELARKAANNR